VPVHRTEIDTNPVELGADDCPLTTVRPEPVEGSDEMKRFVCHGFVSPVGDLLSGIAQKVGKEASPEPCCSLLCSQRAGPAQIARKLR
jgi:hypothetical protein